MAAFDWDSLQDAVPQQAQAAPQGQPFNWEALPDAQAAQPQSPGMAQTALEHFANGATAGYLPQLQALAQPIAFKIGNWLTGENVQPDSYVNARDANAARLGAEAQANPKAAIGSELVGAGAQMLAIPTPAALEAGGIVGGIAKGAAVGAGYGAISNPGDQAGVISPLQLGDRAENAGKGALIGAVAGGVTQGASKFFNKIGNAPESLEQASNVQAVKASGAMLKDFRALNGSDRAQAVGQFALDNGIVKAGDTVKDVAAKASAMQADAGSRLDTLYSQAQQGLEKTGAEVPSDLGLNPGRDKDAILAQVKSALGNKVGKDSAVNQVASYLDQLASDHGDKMLDPKTANDVEGAISEQIKWARNPLNQQPTTEQAFRTLRKIVSDKVDSQVDFLGKTSGNPQAGEQLAQANRDYGMSKTIADMAKDKINRISTNNHWSLTDRIAGGSSALGGELVGSAIDGWTGGAIGGLIGGVSGAVANHLGGQYGNAALAAGLSGASRLAEMGPAQAARAASFAINPQTANLATRAIVGSGTLGGQLPSDGAQPNTQPPNGPALTQSAGVNAMNTQKGPAKWANDGFQKLKGQSSDEDKATLDKFKGAMMADPQGRNLLIAASSYQPGSKGLDQILSKIRSKYGSKK